ncbi:MAG: phage tail protein [Chloroflexota bacterium]
MEEGSRSNYLKYLPALYAEDDFLGRFLMIFEEIFIPLERLLDNIHYYFDPVMAPEEFLAWLASWVNLVLDENWPVERRRRLIHSAAELFRWRGTKRGLEEYLQVYTGMRPAIVEHVSAEAWKGRGTLPAGFATGPDHSFTVILPVANLGQINATVVKSIIELEKPAHTTYTLKIVSKGQEA